MRDTRASVDYFQLFVKNTGYRIYCAESANRAETRPELFNASRCSCILSNKLDLLVAYYSGGIELSIIKQKFLELIPYFYDYWARGVYGDLLTALSFAILFDIDMENFTILKNAAAELKVGRRTEDWLINFMIHSRFPEVSYENCRFIFQKTDLCYQEMIESDSPKEELYRFAKSKWYNKQRGAAWWGSHKKIDRGFPVYFGYWCFEVAAIVKILGIDDTEYKDIVYYPYELAHFSEKGNEK